MKILYFTDNYTWNIYGTKRSTAEALEDAGHEVILVNTENIADIVKLTGSHNPDQIWLFHSDLQISPEARRRISIPIIGFGISDPYYFSEKRFQSYDIYVTYHYDTYLKYKDVIPCIYNATACDFKFHKTLEAPKDIDISVIGLGEHPRFNDKRVRITYTEKLRSETPYTIHTYGNAWPRHELNHGFIDGQHFLEIINRSYLGLDIQDDWSPLAHRMFEYAACAVPTITRFREEVLMYFDKDREIITYADYEELRDKILWYCSRKDELAKIGRAAKERCQKDHDIHVRVKKLLASLAVLT